MARALVIGGGVAGLAAALALARQGHEVEVLEKDSTPLPDDPVTAFERWDRRGAPQVRHSHAFLARLRNLLRDRFPDVLEALLASGAYEIRVTEALPPGITDRAPRPGDEDLALLGCRRITFEWVLRRMVEATPGVSWHVGSEVVGLVAEPDAPEGPPRVGGVRVARAGGGLETRRADLVVDASGRRSGVRQWLAAIGAGPVSQEEEVSGIFYSSRFYRLRAGEAEPPREGPIGADLGYMKYAIFPGDSGIFSVTLAASPDDSPLRAVLRPGPFEAAAAAIPAIGRWIDPARSEPVSDVYGMAKLRNRLRRFVAAGRPLALGLFVIGDAAVCTNPLYGRGCSLAFVHAVLLADALRAHPDDPLAQALALDAATRRELEPWYRAAVAQDQDAREVAEAQRRGAEPAAARASGDPQAPVDPKAFLRSVLRDGLLPALASDAVVLRAFLRNFNLLDPPDSLLSNADVMARVLAAWRERDRRPPAEPLGPDREEMVRVLERAA